MHAECMGWDVVPGEGTYGVVVRFRVSRSADDGGEYWVSIAKVGESL